MYCTRNAFCTSDILHMNPCQITARSFSFSLSRYLSHWFGYLLVSFFAVFSSKLQTVGSRCFTRRMFRFLRFVIFQQLPSYHIQFTCKGWLRSHSNVFGIGQKVTFNFTYIFRPKPHHTTSYYYCIKHCKLIQCLELYWTYLHWISFNSILFHCFAERWIIFRECLVWNQRHAISKIEKWILLWFYCVKLM